MCTLQLISSHLFLGRLLLLLLLLAAAAAALGISISSSFMAAAATLSSSLSGCRGATWMHREPGMLTHDRLTGGDRINVNRLILLFCLRDTSTLREEEQSG